MKRKRNNKKEKKNLNQLIISDALFKEVYGNVHFLTLLLTAFFQYAGLEYQNIFKELQVFEEKSAKKSKFEKNFFAKQI